MCVFIEKYGREEVWPGSYIDQRGVINGTYVRSLKSHQLLLSYRAVGVDLHAGGARSEADMSALYTHRFKP